MTVVIDTNVLPGMFTLGHDYRPIAEAWFCGVFSWAVSTDILLEYEEVLGRLKGDVITHRLLALIESVGALQGNLHYVSPSFFFRTISADRDDDKFADCAISADAELVITNDKHFSQLNQSGYKPQPITPEEFVDKILTNL